MTASVCVSNNEMRRERRGLGRCVLEQKTTQTDFERRQANEQKSQAMLFLSNIHIDTQIHTDRLALQLFLGARLILNTLVSASV